VSDAPKKNRGGRPKGSENKITKEMRLLVRAAAEIAGDRRAAKVLGEAKAKGLKLAESPLGGALGYLADMAEAQPVAFLSVLGKTIEKHVKIDAPRELVIMRDYTGIGLEDLPEVARRKIESARRAAAEAAAQITREEATK
jgi:hypothetical protein